MERFVERFRYKATKARQAQSKLKAIDRLRSGAPESAPGDGRAISFRFGPAERSGRVALELEGATLAAGERTLLEDGELWLERGEHVCLVGPNGCGKSTLVRALAGEAEPESGTVRRGHNVKLGYLRQHADLPAAADATVLAHARRETGLTEARARALLGAFLFSGDEVDKRLDAISGGEAQRLALAILVSSDSNLLVLDEPTNHLDVDSREALEDALRSFEGTLLLVSHDRALLEAVGSRTLVLEDRRLRSYPGGWVEYRAATEVRTPAGSARSPVRDRRDRVDAGPSKNRRAALDRLEREAEAAEAALRALEDELADAALWSDPERSADSARRHTEAERRRDEAYERWERAADEAG